MNLFRVTTNLYKHLYLLSSLSYLHCVVIINHVDDLCVNIFLNFPPKVTVFLDKSGSKLNYRLYGEYLFDILFAGGVLGISLIFLFWLVNTKYYLFLLVFIRLSFNFLMFLLTPTFSQQMCSTFSFYYFIFYIAPGGSVQEEGEKATWRTTVCVFEANDDELKTYVQV